MDSTFTVLSQYSFFVQFVITFVVTLYLYFKYKSEWLGFEKYFFGFFFFITLSNLIAIFFITASGIPYALVIILSNLSLVLLLMAGETLMGIRNKILLYVLPILLFLIDSTVNLLYSLNQLDKILYFIISGTDILLFTIPSILIYIYLTYKTKDISIGFFVLALLLYLAGGFSLTPYGEVYMGVFYTLAVICFAVATVLPIIRQRLHSLSKAESATTS